MKKFILGLLVSVFAMASFSLPVNASYRNYYYEEPYYDPINHVWVQPYSWSEYEDFSYSRTGYYNTGRYSYDYNRYYNYSNNYRTADEELDAVTDLDGNEISNFENRNYGYNYNYRYTNEKVTETVEIRNDKFSPSTITINKNDSVKWINRDSDRHGIVGNSTSYGISSSTLYKGSSYTKTFSKTGTFYYHDKYDSKIKGKIIVE